MAAVAEEEAGRRKKKRAVVVVALNGERVDVESPDPSLTLLSFLRSHTRFTGTKLSCADGASLLLSLLSYLIPLILSYLAS